MKADQLNRIGIRVRFLRQQLGLTQEQLGERSQLHYSYVGQVERGDKMPSLKTLQRLAGALNVPLETLLEEEGVDYYAAPSDLVRQELIKMLEGRPEEDLRLILAITRLILARSVRE